METPEDSSLTVTVSPYRHVPSASHTFWSGAGMQ